MRHICKRGKLEIRAVIKYFCKKGMPPKEIHEDFMETVGKESPYSTVKQIAQWATIAHLEDSIMLGYTIIYDAQRQVTLNLKQ